VTQIVAGFETVNETNWPIRMSSLSGRYGSFAGLRSDSKRFAVIDGAIGFQGAYHFTVAATKFWSSGGFVGTRFTKLPDKYFSIKNCCCCAG
jgi:hypothetical protein